MGRGLAMAKYEIDNGPGGGLFQGTTAAQRIAQNVKNLLRTKKGEVPYDRKRGLDPAFLEMPIGEANKWLMAEVDRCLGWEPRARPISARAELTATGETRITVTVEIDE